MSNFELVLPKLGESITDATIISWLKNVGDTIEEDEPICEIATDKVDSEIPSPVSGVIKEIFYQVDDVVEVGKVIAIIGSEVSNGQT
ncbi:MAG: 2-oxoglutarate dehydrogenase E2 component (dihydrolipoamide succinyltransferase), partial [Cognaticolwellia sp.]